MSAASMYKNYMRLCERWRIDPTKKGRDLGEFIRQQVVKEFSLGEATKINDLKECEKKLNSLNRLANNYYGKKFPRKAARTASGLTREQCQDVLSTESLKILQEQNLSIIDQFRLRLSQMFK